MEKIIINGDDVGAYGQDTHKSFGDLLLVLPFEENLHKIKIDTLHPFWLLKYADALLQVISKGIIGLLVVPVQSAHEKIKPIL